MLRKISREMSRIKRTKTQAVALIMAGTIALSSVLGPSMASADGHGFENLAPNASFETVGSSGFGWVRDARGGDAHLGLINGFASDGNKSVYVYGSESANKGWPGFTTDEIIPVDADKKYTFSASYYTVGNYEGLPWLDMQLFNSDGEHIGGVSTGTSPVLEAPNMWHEKTYNFNPAALEAHFGDEIAGVKLGLKLSLNYGVAGIEDGSTTLMVYDNVMFEEVPQADLIVPSIGTSFQLGDMSFDMPTPVISLELQKTLSTATHIAFTVKNDGTADVTGPIKANTVMTKDGVPWDNGGYFLINYDSPLSPGEEATHKWYPGNGMEPGVYTVQVMVDHVEEIDELDEDNNLSPVISFEIVE